MKQRYPLLVDNDGGSVLMTTVLIMIILTSIGIFAINTSSIEMMISGNEKFHKQAFYNAEGAIRSVYPLLDDIRLGVDPTTFDVPVTGYVFLNFADNTDYFWDEQIDDDNSTAEANPDITFADIRNDAEVDIDRLSTDHAGESIINRAGYEGLGKGVSANWTASYSVMATGRAASQSEAQTSADIVVVR